MFLRPFYQLVNQRIDVIECYLIYQDTLREGKIAIFAKILKIQICHLNQFTIAGQHCYRVLVNLWVSQGLFQLNIH